jgi:hypothetical protein
MAALVRGLNQPSRRARPRNAGSQSRNTGSLVRAVICSRAWSAVFAIGALSWWVRRGGRGLGCGMRSIMRSRAEERSCLFSSR